MKDEELYPRVRLNRKTKEMEPIPKTVKPDYNKYKYGYMIDDQFVSKMDFKKFMKSYKGSRPREETQTDPEWALDTKENDFERIGREVAKLVNGGAQKDALKAIGTKLNELVELVESALKENA